MALVLATAGTALAIGIGQFGVGALREGARQKVVGVGKLVHVTTTTDVPVTTVQQKTTSVKATCPTAPIGDLQPMSGGVKLEVKDPDFAVLDSTSDRERLDCDHLHNNTADPHKADLILSCARSIAVSGSTLPTS